MLIDGALKNTLSPMDRGFQYGDGVFETIAVVDAKPCLWQRHLQRLIQSCGRLGIPCPETLILRQEAEVEIGDCPRGVLKITVSRGISERGYRPNSNATTPTRVIYCQDWPDYPQANWQQGIAVYLCETRLGLNPQLAGIKHLNRLEQVMAAAEWDPGEFAEGLMLDQQNHVIEGTRSNFFMVVGGNLITPSIEQAGVFGIMRGLVIETAKHMGITVEERTVNYAEVLAAEALFLTNSLIGIWPIARVQDHLFSLQAIDPELQRRVMEAAFTPE